MKYRAMKDHADRFPIRLMCRALKVSSAGYYAWIGRPESARAQMNRHLLADIGTFHIRSDRTYGSPRIAQDLRDVGYTCGENRVARRQHQSRFDCLAQPHFIGEQNTLRDRRPLHKQRRLDLMRV